MAKANKHAQIIAAWGQGHDVQMRPASSNNPWEDCGAAGDDNQPGWFEDFEYRLKPCPQRFYIAIVAARGGGIYLETPHACRDEALADVDGADTVQRVLQLDIDAETCALVHAMTSRP